MSIGEIGVLFHLFVLKVHAVAAGLSTLFQLLRHGTLFIMVSLFPFQNSILLIVIVLTVAVLVACQRGLTSLWAVMDTFVVMIIPTLAIKRIA